MQLKLIMDFDRCFSKFWQMHVAQLHLDEVRRQ